MPSTLASINQKLLGKISVVEIACRENKVRNKSFPIIRFNNPVFELLVINVVFFK
jgi:hypothetical protein